MTVPVAYKRYLLAVLMVILAFNYVDRLALGLVLQDVKADLALSDTQLGLLSGIAFALFYSVMGIPIARWADRGNRVVVIALTTLLWSAAVAFCGMAASFLQLLTIRIGVAVGEAGCIPPAHSLIADHFGRSERPRAVAIYLLGGVISSVVGYFIAGWLNECYGWRTTFVLLGLPGLVLAPLAWMTLNEPRCHKRIQSTSSGTRSGAPRSHELGGGELDTPSAKEVWLTLWNNATFRHLLLCFSVMYFFGNGIMKWQPAFFIRTYGVETGALGTWLAVIYGVSGLLGTYWGGEWASRRAANNERRQLRVMAILYTVFGAIQSLVYVSPNQYVAFGFLALATLGGTAVAGPALATIQTLVPPRMRAMSVAILYLFANLIGTGLGPLTAGALSDALRPYVGELSLRYALLALCPGCVWVTWHLWQASKTVTRDLEAARLDPNGAVGEELYGYP